MRIAAFAAACVFIGATHAAPAQTRTTWDGVYSSEQADRGEKVYLARCARCHGDNLLGGEAPALTGPVFGGNWEGAPLSDMFDRIRTTMPQERPGSLSRQETADLLAHMLKIGKYPAAAAPLATDDGALGQITFVTFRP